MEVRFGRNFADNEPGLLKPGCLSEPKPPLPPECAGIKAEQENINKGIAKQEFINMLLTKTNVFRNELFNLKVKSKEIQAKIQHDIDFINLNIEFESIGDLRRKKANSIGNLICDLNNVKQELAGAKAFLAEVRNHSKDSPALSTKTEPQNLELTSQKLQALNDDLCYNIVRMKWACAELKSYFEHEKLLRDKMKFALAKLNVNSEPPLQPLTPENKHGSSAPERTHSHFEMITKLNNMATRLSKLSCGPSEEPTVPISAPAPTLTDIPLPKPTFEPKPANLESVDTQPLFPKAEPVWPRFEMLFKNNMDNHVSSGSTSKAPTSASAPALNPTPMFKPDFKTKATKRRPTLRVARRRFLGTTVVQFKPLETDVIGDTGTSKDIYQCITLMAEYENKSLEELRLEDYIRMGRITKKVEIKAFFGALGGLGTTIAFNPVVGTDVIYKSDDRREEITVNYQCITMMKEYEHLSLEEIRLQDFIIKGRFTKLQQKSNAFVGEISGEGTTPFQFKPLSESEMYAGAKITVNLQCITCMKEYKDKSIDELRLEDYCIASRVRKQYSAVSSFAQPKKIEEFFSAKKAMPIFSSPTLENWNKFGQGPKTPSQTQVTPTRSRETPTLWPKTPTQASETPSRAPETPTRWRKIPTRASKTPTPTHAHGTPTRASETATQARDAPTKSRETPTQAREKPTRASETPTRLAERKKEAGERFCELKNYEEAVNMFSEACKLCPESPVYLTDRAGALMKLGKHREALEDAKKAVAIDEAFTAGYIRIARCCLILGEVASGELAARRANDLAPSCACVVHGDLQTLRKMRENARQLMDKDNYYDALSALNFCLKHYSPSCSKTKLMKAECLVSMRKYQEARDIAIPLSRLNGFDAEAIYIVGLCSFHQENDEQAIKYFQNVLQVDPDHERAIKMYKLAKTRKNNKAILEKKLMGNEAFKRNDLQRALNLYSEGLAIDKNNKEENAKLYYNKSTVYVKLNQINNAVQACTAALDINENYLKALSRRARCYAEIKRYQESLDDYENLYFIEPNDQNRHALNEAHKVLRAHIGADYYYKILEISKNASKDDIKKAYRDKARLYHPDKHACASVPVIRKNERKFKQTKEAYDVLSDPIRRAEYDRFQKNGQQWKYCSDSG